MFLRNFSFHAVILISEKVGSLIKIKEKAETQQDQGCNESSICPVRRRGPARVPKNVQRFVIENIIIY